MSETVTVMNGRSRRPLAIIAGVTGLLIAASAVLWAYYGTAVFYEVILAGIAMCL